MTWTEIAPFASIVTLLVNLGALFVAYGKMTEKVDNLDTRVTVHETDVKKALGEIRAFEMSTTEKFASSESIKRIEEKIDKIAERIDRVVDQRRP